MKKMMFTLMAMLTIAASANAMSYEQARNEALFLTDKMAYELNLSDAQYEAAYEINLDYLMGVTSIDDVYGPYWERRNLDLSYVLFTWQWDLYRAASYFFRPLYWNAGYWHFGIYARYPHRDYFYFGRPHFYASYRGGHSWHMNGGRSFYEGHRDHYRPGHVTRDNHFGMRNGWDRGDYRNNRGHGSSTRVTAGQHNGSNSHPGNGGNVGNGHRDNTPGNGGNVGNGHRDNNPGNGGNVGNGHRDNRPGNGTRQRMGGTTTQTTGIQSRPTTTTARPTTSTVRPSTSTVRPTTSTVRPSTSTVRPTTTTVRPSTTTRSISPAHSTPTRSGSSMSGSHSRGGSNHSSVSHSSNRGGSNRSNGRR